MSHTFKYDPLDILDRAEKSADEWWSNTLKSAKARTDLDQQHFENAFKNDKQFMTHESDLFKTNNENVYKGTKANYDTMLEPDRYDTQKAVYGRNGLAARNQSVELANGLTPENIRARNMVNNNHWQSPAATLEANAASAGIMDQSERARVAAESAGQWDGALGAQAVYGQQGAQAGALNIGNMIMSGSWDQANEHLTKSGVNMRIKAGDKPGTVVIVTPDGRKSAPMDPSNAAKIFNDQAGVKAGQSQVYTDRYSAEMRGYDNKMELNNAKLAQRDNYLQYKMQTEEGRRLNGAYQAAVKEGDKAKIQEAWNDVQAFQQRSSQEFDQGAGGPVYAPGGQPAQRLSDTDLIVKPRQATAAQQAPAAPAAQAPYQPPSSASAAPTTQTPKVASQVATQAPAAKQAAPIDPAEEVGIQLDKAKAARSKIQESLRKIGTVERMKDRNGYDRLMNELEAAKLAEGELQRKYERMVHVAPYSPYTVPISK